MSLELLLVAIIPIVLFVVVEIRYGVKAGVIAAMAAAVALGAYLYFRFGYVDEMYLVELALILVLGGLSLKMQKSRYFKLQPLVVGIVFAGYAFILQWNGDPFLVRMLPVMIKMMPPEKAQLLTQPFMIRHLTALSWQMGVLILAHGLCCGWAAYRLSSTGWLMVRLAIYPAMLILMVVSGVMMGRP